MENSDLIGLANRHKPERILIGSCEEAANFQLKKLSQIILSVTQGTNKIPPLTTTARRTYFKSLNVTSTQGHFRQFCLIDCFPILKAHRVSPQNERRPR